MSIAQMIGAEHNTAAALKSAIARAEAEYAVSEMPPTKGTIVILRPSEVQMRVELFQPREFSAGYYEVDKAYVRKLAKHIENVGELDPIIVIKLGAGWVCVDGHHRVEAYKLNKWPGTISCSWFDGTVREAVCASIEGNRTLKLEVPRVCRQEQAWKHVLLGMGSKSEQARRCGVSERMIAHMRSIKKEVHTKTPKGRELLALLHNKSLMDASWTSVKLAWINATPVEADLEKRARTLALYMRSRLEGRLSDDPKVTAKALAIYDAELPGPLAQALQNSRTEEERAGCGNLHRTISGVSA
jgi:hypothetical protein